MAAVPVVERFCCASGVSGTCIAPDSDDVASFVRALLGAGSSTAKPPLVSSRTCYKLVEQSNQHLGAVSPSQTHLRGVVSAGVEAADDDARQLRGIGRAAADATWARGTARRPPPCSSGSTRGACGRWLRRGGWCRRRRGRLRQRPHAVRRADYQATLLLQLLLLCRRCVRQGRCGGEQACQRHQQNPKRALRPSAD